MHAVDIDVVILYCRYFIAYDNESITYRKIPIFKDRVAKRLSKFHDTMLKLYFVIKAAVMRHPN